MVVGALHGMGAMPPSSALGLCIATLRDRRHSDRANAWSLVQCSTLAAAGEDNHKARPIGDQPPAHPCARSLMGCDPSSAALKESHRRRIIATAIGKLGWRARP